MDSFGEVLRGEGTPVATALLVAAAGLLVWLAWVLPAEVKGLAEWVRRRHILRKVPCSPGAVPVLGHALVLMKSIPWDCFVNWCANHGPVTRCQILHKDLVLIDDPALLKQVFQSKMSRYQKDTGFSYYPFLPLLGTGLVTAEGKLWRKQRSLVSVHFRVEILDDIVDISKRAADRLYAKLSPMRGTGEPARLAEEFRHLTLQVIGEAILSMSHEEADKVFPLLYLPIMEEANKRSLRPWREYVPNLEWFAHKKRIAALDVYIVGILRERWARRYGEGGRSNAPAGPSKPAADIVDRIMDDVAKEGVRWNKTVERQLCFEIKTFMLAGHETSAAMLAWALYELCKNPECMAHVVEEADRVFGSDGDKPVTREEVSGMDYTYAVLKEALRKYSIVPVVTRMCKEDDVLGGYVIPRGTTIGCLLQGVHHRPDIWPEPDRFDPGRFLGEAKVDPYTFLPFIDGPRNCLGQHLALLEGRVLLAYLVKKLKFELFTDREGERHSLVVPIAPAHHMRMTVN